MQINYQTATKQEIFNKIDQIIREAAGKLSDSPISRARQISNHIGFFQGVAMVRGFEYSFSEIAHWYDLV